MAVGSLDLSLLEYMYLYVDTDMYIYIYTDMYDMCI